jgi:signal transduction histidine kinase
MVTSRDAADATGAGWQVLDEDGTVLDSGGPAPSTSLVPGRELREVGGEGFHTFEVGSVLPIAREPFRVRVSALKDAARGGPSRYVLVAVRRGHRDEALRELLVQLTIAGLGTLVVVSLVGDLLARLALRPVERYRRRAAEIASGASDLRLEVPPGRDDEVTRLGDTLNEMLAALRESLDRERQFVDDASHELRTPLTLLRSRIQLTRRRSRSVEEHERALDELEVDVTRLTDLADQLLSLSHETERPAIPVDVAQAVTTEVERWHRAHPDRASDVVVVTPDGAVPARVDEHGLERVVVNLVTNGLMHGLPPVEIRVRRDGDHVFLEVADAGVGMPPDLLAQATRRFNRAPEARSKPGAGLGLSIVERLVTEAGGELRLCYAGQHLATGRPAAVQCRHDDRMTVSVILPATTSL